MKMFRICGYGSGRSALVYKLVEEFGFRKIGLAVIKHAHKPFDMDKEGSDTYKLRQRGCQQTMIASCDRWALLGETPEQLAARADAAMHEAKRRGKGRIVVAAPAGATPA